MAEHVVRYYFKIETIDVYVKLFSDLANMVSEIDVLPFLAITGNMFNAIYEYARLVKLINKLSEDFNIQKKVVSHNTQVYDIDKFEGIVFRSNYNKNSTDLSPALDYNKFKQLIENE